MPIVAIVVIIAAVAVGGFFMSRGGQTESTAPAPTSLMEAGEESAVEADEEGSVELETEMLPPLPESAAVDTDPAVSQLVDTSSAPVVVSGEYKDGTYNTVTSYFTPSNVEHKISVSLTLAGDTVTGAEVLYDGEVAKTPSHTRFESAWQSAVIGVDLEDVSLSRTGGASLTSESFNEAVDTIKQEAAA